MSSAISFESVPTLDPSLAPSATELQSSRLPNNPASPTVPPYEPHNGENRQYIRDIILGFNDGLISMFLLVFGLSGGGATTHSILLAGITGALAGAISMGLGEYLATKSQLQVQQADIALEQDHFKYHREQEIAEMKDILQNLGLEGDLLEEVSTCIGSKDESLLKFMVAFEFGATEEDQRNPLVAMAFSLCLFITGSLPSVIPFACTNSVKDATIAAGVLCVVACFALGAVKCITTKGNWLKSGSENVLMAIAGAGISYAVGAIYHAAGGNAQINA